jgi:hypothetical protein
MNSSFLTRTSGEEVINNTFQEVAGVRVTDQLKSDAI